MDSQTNNSPPLSLYSQAVVFKNPPPNHCGSHEVWGYSPTYLSPQRGDSQEIYPGAAPMTKNLLEAPTYSTLACSTDERFSEAAVSSLSCPCPENG